MGRRLGLAHVLRRCDWSSYEHEFEQGLRDLKAAHGITHVVCGDIVYPEHRAWAERLSAQAEAGATSVKDMGKVMAALKSRYAGQMDFAKASALVKTKLG